jgi:CDP-glucose 4,6-dehydratase
MIDKDFWNGRRVFLTGHSGFKGSWMSLWLSSMGAIVKGYALDPPSSPSLFNEANLQKKINSNIGDIRDFLKLKKSLLEFNPEIIFHMAAQPLVRYSYDNPVETYEVNVIGTMNLLEAARSCDSLHAIINITTDKCYENLGYEKSYKESDPLGGHDPYSSSKGCSEILTSSYWRSFFKSKGVGVATARAGNVIGGGDWAFDRLIPDILMSFDNDESVLIRNPKATRPWQHVLEPLSGYLVLGQKLYLNCDKYSDAWNFGPDESDSKPVEWILNNMTSKWPNSSWKLDNNFAPHEAGFLKLDISKAKIELGWQPTWNLDFSLKKVVDWHKAWKNNENMQIICLHEIEDYMKDFNNE